VKSRVLTAFGLIPFVLGAFFCASPWPLFALSACVSIVCAIELAALLKSPGPYLGVLWAFVAFLPRHYKYSWPYDEQVTVVGYFILGLVCTLLLTQKKTRVSFLSGTFAAFWFMIPLICLNALHFMHHGANLWNYRTPALLAFVPLWGGDTAAIFVGKAFGKHPLAHAISPNKTVEGGVANVVSCLAVALPLGIWVGTPLWLAALCGLVAGFLGQMGDLFESYVKRRVGVKDSGKLLPGHGGMLDRIDSILFTAPFVYLILSLVKYP
jgi:phosphatidate cytidylyltransferase